MPRSVRQAVAPVYLFLCLCLGGSAQGILGNALLELIGVAIIIWAMLAPSGEASNPFGRQLAVIGLAGLGLVLLQMIPLPASVWPHLGGRSVLAEGFGVLGLEVPARPLSLTPHEGWASLVELIPPVALLCAITRLNAYRPTWLAFALTAGTIAAIMLGALQAASAEPENSPWYLYADSSFGVATGFFANANHMALLMVATVPFLAALLARARGASVQRYSSSVALLGGTMLVVLLGVYLNESVAGYVLLIPVLAGSIVLAFPQRPALRRGAIAAASLLIAAGAAIFVATPAGDRAFEPSGSIGSRKVILATSVEATKDFLPLGSGLGSFRGVYKLYEDHQRIDRTYVNHAHNDYLELALELGIPGIILMVLFLLWWARVAWSAWRIRDEEPFAGAATIATAALLVHSFIEFPLRSIALSALFGACLALMIVRRQTSEPDKSDLWPTRHIEVK